MAGEATATALVPLTTEPAAGKAGESKKAWRIESTTLQHLETLLNSLDADGWYVKQIDLIQDIHKFVIFATPKHHNPILAALKNLERLERRRNELLEGRLPHNEVVKVVEVPIPPEYIAATETAFSKSFSKSAAESQTP
jgi:hypothetical protein